MNKINCKPYVLQSTTGINAGAEELIITGTVNWNSLYPDLMSSVPLCITFNYRCSMRAT
jgi:hypothetical protein